jgi:protein-S-isoprenylcysteine O-methyltransferase Ste14
MDSNITPASWGPKEGNLGEMSVRGSGLRTMAALTALAVVFAIALTFATTELPRVVSNFLAEYFPDYLPVQPEAQDTLRALRPVGYACLAAVAILILVGFALRKRNLSSVGVLAFFLPTFGYFASYMFFLAGLGVLRTVWIPFWDPGIMGLGDIAYLPYMAVVYPFHLVGIDVRMALAHTLVCVGFFLFVLGTVAWFYGKMQKQNTVTFWIYRYSRHPQYLGFIVWSYGIMLLAAYVPVPFGGVNPGASLPWIISTLLVICVALSEEAKMSRADRRSYLAYRQTAPFLIPVPGTLSRAVTAPLRFVLRKGGAETRRDIACAFGLYLVVVLVLSLPLVVLNWPGQDWSIWPSGRAPRMGPAPKGNDFVPEGDGHPAPGGDQAPEPSEGGSINEVLPLDPESFTMGGCVG